MATIFEKLFEELMTQFQPGPYQFHPLPPEEAEIDAIDTYLRDSGFVNSPLRGTPGYGGLSQAQKEVVDTLDRLIQNSPVTKKDMIVYRAVSEDRFPKTDRFVDKGFVSTTIPQW